jgi:hypothetical protein
MTKKERSYHFALHRGRLSEWRESYILEIKDVWINYQSDITWNNSFDRVPDSVVQVMAKREAEAPTSLRFVPERNEKVSWKATWGVKTW